MSSILRRIVCCGGIRCTHGFPHVALTVYCIAGVRYVPNVGKVTVAMLERNCVRLRQMYGGHSNREAEQTIIDGAPAVAQSPPISS